MGTDIIDGDRHKRRGQTLKVGTDIKGGDRHNRWGQTKTVGTLLLALIVKYQCRLTAGWLAGSVSDYSTTLWLHLASWNLPDSQLS